MKAVENVEAEKQSNENWIRERKKNYAVNGFDEAEWMFGDRASHRDALFSNYYEFVLFFQSTLYFIRFARSSDVFSLHAYTKTNTSPLSFIFLNVLSDWSFMHVMLLLLVVVIFLSSNSPSIEFYHFQCLFIPNKVIIYLTWNVFLKACHSKWFSSHLRQWDNNYSHRSVHILDGMRKKGVNIKWSVWS